MKLRFRFGKVFSNSHYQDAQLATIDAQLDEQKIRNRLALSYKGLKTGLGGKPIDPVIGYKAHLLYFLKRDIISFNELPRQRKKESDYQAFCRCQGVAFTASYLSRFRERRLTGEVAAQLHRDILSNLRLETETAPLRIGIWDSVPMPSYSTPVKDTRHCECQDPCECERHFSDPDAAIGWQRPTPTKKDKFIGYRKHTVVLYSADKDQRLAIATAVCPANEADIDAIEQALCQCSKLIDILLVDQAIYDFEPITDWLTRFGVLVLVKPKSNAVLDGYPLLETKTPCCPEMSQPLVWSHLDFSDHTHVYRCGVLDCIHQFNCPRQFEIPMAEPPAVLGVFPPHTRWGRLLVAPSGLIEPEFGVQTLWTRLKRLPFRGFKAFALLGQLCDTTRLLAKLASAPT